MSHRRQSSLVTRLLQALDWVRRSGWTTYAEDTALAARVLDTWKAASAQAKQQGRCLDRRVLWETLHIVFSDRYGDEVARHLTVIFTVSLEQHLRRRNGLE